MRALALLFALLLAPLAPGAAELEPAPPDLDAGDIARRADGVLRGETTYTEATMTVVSRRLTRPRTIAMRSWEHRPSRRTFIRIDSPPKDSGVSFLLDPPNLWQYIPRVERTIRIPPSMMLQGWMGSDFTNDDLSRTWSEIDDYEHRLLGVDPRPDGESGPAYVVEYVPHEDAPVVWGRITSWIDVATYAPIRREFFDEGGEKLRLLEMTEIRDVQGRPVPHRWVMTPLDKKGHSTTLVLEAVRFDEDMDEGIFTKRNLRRGD